MYIQSPTYTLEGKIHKNPETTSPLKRNSKGNKSFSGERRKGIPGGGRVSYGGGGGDFPKSPFPGKRRTIIPRKGLSSYLRARFHARGGGTRDAFEARGGPRAGHVTVFLAKRVIGRSGDLFGGSRREKKNTLPIMGTSQFPG